jgi:hypothetical protein
LRFFKENELHVRKCGAFSVVINKAERLSQSPLKLMMLLSRVLVTETGFGLVLGFINRVTVLNYKQ